MGKRGKSTGKSGCSKHCFRENLIEPLKLPLLQVEIIVEFCLEEWRSNLFVTEDMLSDRSGLLVLSDDHEKRDSLDAVNFQWLPPSKLAYSFDVNHCGILQLPEIIVFLKR